MSDDAQEQQTTIPYRKGVKPLSWPWPQQPRTAPPPPKPEPHSRDAYFTNPDMRLRPREPSLGPILYFTPSNPRLEVTSWNFPEMHAEFMRMQTALGLSGYRLFIIPEYRSGAFVSYNPRQVNVGANFLNQMNYDGVNWVLGHELGHAWRHANPKAPTLRSSLPLTQGTHVSEVEADIVSACLEGNVARTLNGMQILKNPIDRELHPSGAKRRQYVASTPLSQCILLDAETPDNDFMPVPYAVPKLKPSTAHKKARE